MSACFSLTLLIAGHTTAENNNGVSEHLSAFKLAAQQQQQQQQNEANGKESAGQQFPYPHLLPGLYQQHLAAMAMASGGINPTSMLLNAQLALAAQQNPLLASAYANMAGGGGAGGAMAAAERLRAANRFSPYSTAATVAAAGATSPTISAGSSGGSAFESVAPKKQSSSPPSSPPLAKRRRNSSASSPAASDSAVSSSSAAAAAAAKSHDLLSIEKMVNGLDRSKAAVVMD